MQTNHGIWLFYVPLVPYSPLATIFLLPLCLQETVIWRCEGCCPVKTCLFFLLPSRSHHDKCASTREWQCSPIRIRIWQCRFAMMMNCAHHPIKLVLYFRRNFSKSINSYQSNVFSIGFFQAMQFAFVFFDLRLQRVMQLETVTRELTKCKKVSR